MRFLLLIAVVCVGCSAGESEPAQPPTLKEQFLEQQRGTNTPDGAIDPDSVTESDGVVTFEAGDATYSQRYEQTPDGAYRRLGDPERVEPTGVAPH